MPLPPAHAWFPTKRYGYGWGPPRRWQGWLVLLAYFGALFGNLPLSRERPAWFMLYAVVLTALLLGICYWKGEAPRWRWGDQNDRRR
jgi:hypothetical protein